MIQIGAGGLESLVNLVPVTILSISKQDVSLGDCLTLAHLNSAGEGGQRPKHLPFCLNKVR